MTPIDMIKDKPLCALVLGEICGFHCSFGRFKFLLNSFRDASFLTF